MGVPPDWRCIYYLDSGRGVPAPRRPPSQESTQSTGMRFPPAPQTHQRVVAEQAEKKRAASGDHGSWASKNSTRSNSNGSCEQSMVVTTVRREAPVVRPREEVINLDDLAKQHDQLIGTILVSFIERSRLMPLVVRQRKRKSLRVIEAIWTRWLH